VESWLESLQKIIGGVTGFVENVKEGDLVGIYENLKDFHKLINSNEDLFKGTEIDDKIKAKLQEASANAETFLMNKLTGGDPKKIAEVKEILGLVDMLILGSGAPYTD
jgi:hypothetical protein